MSPRPFVFLDRDGTLLADPGYLHRLEDYELLAGVVEGLRALQGAGFGLAIVTNQSGIGRGYFTREQFDALQAHLIADLGQHGVRVDGSYCCPHLPDAGCDCRKPATGMLRRAETELGADLANSWVIGDAASDIELARRAGCRAVKIGSAASPGAESAGGLEEAARRILAHMQ